MAELAELERLCHVLPDRIEAAGNQLAKQVVQAVADDVIDHTPVDTSEAESNWQASLNGPPAAPLPPIYPGSHGSTAEESAQAAKEHVQRTLVDKKPGEPVWLSNLAEHIEDLNNGTSAQEPAGFVERAVMIGEQMADKGVEVTA